VRILLLSLLIPLALYSQESLFRIEQEIPFRNSSGKLTMPLAGGLNAVQFNTMDVNGDGQEDAVIWDRMGKCVKVFIRTSTGYRFSPDHEKFFPRALSAWLIIRDFNGDGKKDLFTGDPLGMRAYVNTTPAGGTVSFRRYHPGFPILTKGFTSSINLKVNENDVPAIDDLDGDGDLDILAANFTGNGYIEYHRNLSVERTGSADSLQLERVTQAWGNIRECDCGLFAFQSDCPPSPGRQSHAGGKSLLVFDEDGDGDKDLLYGEEECDRVFLLHNKGDKDTALMDGYNAFPFNDPVSLPLFPSSWLAELDNDGSPEFLFSVNGALRLSPETDYAKSLLVYDKTPAGWSLSRRDFLQSEMVDVGDASFPAVFDDDGDGDLDLLIGSGSQGILRFTNTGTATAPDFLLEKSDYLGLSALGYSSVKPQFADMDADGKPDLAFTAIAAGTGVKTLFYIPNRASKGFDAGIGTVVETGYTLPARENIRLWDVNGDRYPDILRINSGGALDYLKNTGNNSFELQVSSLAGIGTDITRSYANVTAGDLNADNRADLIIGKPNGTLQLVMSFLGTEPVEQMQVILNSIDGTYYDPRLGGEVFPVVANLFGSRFPAILTGNTLGGLLLLRNTDTAPLPDKPVFSVYPNPASEGQNIYVAGDRPATVQVFTLSGQPVSTPVSIEPGAETQLTQLNLPPAVYIARFRWQNRSKGIRFIRR